jgi:hypothetical protein
MVQEPSLSDLRDDPRWAALILRVPALHGGTLELDPERKIITTHNRISDPLSKP